MIQYKDMREFREEYNEVIEFKNVTIHGDADINEELPSSFTVSLTPSSMARLKKGFDAVKDGADVSGTRVRGCDVKSSLPGHRVKDARILVFKKDQNYIHCELQCFCIQSVCCFISEVTLHNSWFEGE